LYDLHKDPKENNNLIYKDPKRAQLLQEHLKLILQEQLRTDKSDTKITLDEKTRKQLESLGYIGSGGLNEDFDFDSKKGDPKDSISLYKQTMAVNTCLKAKRFTEAENICRAMLAERPDYILNYFLLGEVATARNNAAQSIENYSEFLSQVNTRYSDPSGNLPVFLKTPVHYACHNIGAAFAQQENFEKAIEFYNKALKLDPADPKTYNGLGFAFFSLGNLDEAIKYYTKALELDPGFPEANFNLANTLLEQGKIDEAVAHYKKALELKPDWPDARKNLLIAQMRKKEKEETSPAPLFKLP
jgi:tetratricopeptide (TPR) repeat protein